MNPHSGLAPPSYLPCTAHIKKEAPPLKGWPPFNPPPRTHGVNIHLNLQLCGGSFFLLSDYYFLVVPLMPAHVLWPTAVCISLTQIQSFLLSRNVICS